MTNSQTTIDESRVDEIGCTTDEARGTEIADRRRDFLNGRAMSAFTTRSRHQ